MSERNELPEQDRKLLEKIEGIVANGGGERREADSLYGLCAHLASTVPQTERAAPRAGRAGWRDSPCALR